MRHSRRVDELVWNLALRTDNGAILASDGDAGEPRRRDGLEGVLDLVQATIGREDCEGRGREKGQSCERQENAAQQ